MLHQRRRQPSASAGSPSFPNPPSPVTGARPPLPATSSPGNSAYVPLRRPSQSSLPPPPVPGETNGFDSYSAGSYGALTSGSYSASAAQYSSPASAYPAYGRGGGGKGHSRGLSLNLDGLPGVPGIELGEYGYGGGFDPTTPLGRARRGIEDIKAGARDAVRVDRSLGLVWGDIELRSLVLKLTLINLLSLLLLSLFPLVLSPIFSSNTQASRAVEVGFWYNVLLSWPTFAVCFWVNAIWGPDVARRAQAMLHPAYRMSSSTTPQNQSPTVFSDPVAWAWVTLMRLLLIADFTLVGRALALIPLLGMPLGIAYMSIITSYYPYEWIFTARGWTIDMRCKYISDRAAYMLGFGLPATLLTSFGPPLVNMALFALVYPFLLIQALQSRPPSAHSILPVTPSPASSGPTTPINGEFPSSSVFAAGHVGGGGGIGGPQHGGPVVRIPIFFFARHTLAGLQWLVEAVGRERGGYAASRRRGSKRAL